MNKRGQVFLIAAIIFSIAIYSVAIEYNTIKTYPGLEDYKELSENYQTEYPKVFNFAIYNGSDTGEALSNFTQAFLAQTEQTDPNFGVFYLYKDNEGNIHIVNTLNNKALRLEFTPDELSAEETSLMLLSENTPSEGSLCVNEITCSTTDTIVGNFDTAYFSTEITVQDELRIITPDGAFADVNVTNFTSMNYITTSDPTPLLDSLDQVAVSLIQY